MVPKVCPSLCVEIEEAPVRLGDTWQLDEVFVSIHGEQQYLWRAVDQDGDTIDMLVQPRRNTQAAVRFFRTKEGSEKPQKLPTRFGEEPFF